MNKNDLIGVVADTASITKAQAGEAEGAEKPDDGVVDAEFEEVEDEHK